MEHLFTLLSLIFQIILETTTQTQCKKSLTTASGSSVKKLTFCSGELIFNENFDKFDLNVWQHEQTLSGGGNWEFQWYTNNRSVSFVKNGELYIKPHLVSEEFGENFLYSGTLDLNGGSPADQCTNPRDYGCLRIGNRDNILNPIKSARIRTLNSFRFKYGKIEARIKLPAGDWIWPAFWLLPHLNVYGGWPASGEIDIMESRGNRDYVNSHGKNIGVKLSSSTLHWGTSYFTNKYSLTHFEQMNSDGFDKNFHLYQLEWTPEKFIFSIDNHEIGVVAPNEGGFWNVGNFNNTLLDNPWKRGTKMAPFDQEFYILMNLAVGGINYFPDDDARNLNGKPWNNKSPRASTDFWKGKEQWLPTWKMNTYQQSLRVDYIKVWAL